MGQEHLENSSRSGDTTPTSSSVTPSVDKYIAVPDEADRDPPITQYLATAWSYEKER